MPTSSIDHLQTVQHEVEQLRFLDLEDDIAEAVSMFLRHSQMFMRSVLPVMLRLTFYLGCRWQQQVARLSTFKGTPRPLQN